MDERRELIQVSDTVRVEYGPAMKTAVATDELLKDTVTPRRYYEGKKVFSDGSVGDNVDSFGKPIRKGEEMTFVDEKGQWAYHIYELRDVMVDEKGKETTDEKEATYTVFLDAGGNFTVPDNAETTEERIRYKLLDAEGRVTKDRSKAVGKFQRYYVVDVVYDRDEALKQAKKLAGGK